ncbi:hypothetical protein FKM82_031112 [Ascaphus truei]
MGEDLGMGGGIGLSGGGFGTDGGDIGMCGCGIVVGIGDGGGLGCGMWYWDGCGIGTDRGNGDGCGGIWMGVVVLGQMGDGCGTILGWVGVYVDRVGGSIGVWDVGLGEVNRMGVTGGIGICGGVFGIECGGVLE